MFAGILRGDFFRLIMGDLHKKYQEFKQLYLQEYGIELTDEEAEEMGDKLLRLARAIQKYKKVKNNEK